MINHFWGGWGKATWHPSHTSVGARGRHRRKEGGARGCPSRRGVRVQPGAEKQEGGEAVGKQGNLHWVRPTVPKRQPLPYIPKIGRLWRDAPQRSRQTQGGGASFYCRGGGSVLPWWSSWAEHNREAGKVGRGTWLERGGRPRV